MTKGTPAPRTADVDQHNLCDVTIIMLVFNEELHIARALESVRPFAREVVVIDSYSTDRTVEIAQTHGAKVLQNKWVNYSEQYRWGMENADIRTEWTMRMDADEVIEADLVREIQTRLPQLDEEVVAINFDRKQVFMGRWVRHGGRYPMRVIRIWRTGKGRIENRWMDEHMIVEDGEIVTFRGGYADCNDQDLTWFTAKHNGYATREAIDVLAQRYDLFDLDDLNSRNSSWQAQMKRWLKEKVYNRLPLWMGPLGYFIYRYIFQLGFLDGRTGTIYHVLQGFWYRYLVACKVFEYERQLKKLKSRDERVQALSRFTGYDLVSEPIRK